MKIHPRHYASDKHCALRLAAVCVGLGLGMAIAWIPPFVAQAFSHALVFWGCAAMGHARLQKTGKDSWKWNLGAAVNALAAVLYLIHPFLT